MDDLFVEVRDRDVIVSRPSRGQSVTYRKDHGGPLLVALDPIRDDHEPLAFLAKAWKAAYHEAKGLGWL
jgi:hypothetical protein